MLDGGERIPLKGTVFLPFKDGIGKEYVKKIQIDRVLGQGRTCICYACRVYENDGTFLRRILKQFYPLPLDIETTVNVDERTAKMLIVGFHQRRDIQDLADGFQNAYKTQVELANTDDLMDVVVRPDIMFVSEDRMTQYALFEANYGESLEKIKITKAEEIIRLAREMMNGLHEIHERANLLVMDIKPENLMWVDRKQVKFFDFDSSIRLDNIEEVHSVSGDLREGGALLAPELRQLADSSTFEQNKKNVLSRQLDIYACGTLLFKLLTDEYPSEEACRNFENEQVQELLRKSYEDRFRGEFTKEQQKQLSSILKRSISLRRTGRFFRASEMAARLKTLLDSMHLSDEDSDERKQEKEWQWLTAADVLSRYPVSDYRTVLEENDGEKEYELSVALIGDARIRLQFFKLIFSCAQMWKTKLKIHLISSDAQSYRQAICLSMPALGRTVRIFQNGAACDERPLDRQIVEEPLAQLHFWHGVELQQFLLEEHPSYFLVLTEDRRYNYEYAGEIAGILAEQGTDSGSFVGYFDRHGTIDYRQYKNIKLVPFGSTPEEKQKFPVREQALKIHKFYTREWNEYASIEEIRKDFRSSLYYLRSSLRAAVSVYFRLSELGLPFDEAAIPEYCRIRAGEADILEKLMYLEHRSWNAFMICEGYTRPEDDEVRKYAFRGRNDQRNRKLRLHPFLCSSTWNRKKRLEELPPEKWEQEGKAHLKEYDGLDRMSLQIHSICEERTKKLNLESRFEQLRNELRVEQSKEGLELLDILRSISDRMITGELMSNMLWTFVNRKFREYLDSSRLMNEQVRAVYSEILQEMRVVTERNSYKNYRMNDISVLNAIPELLLQKPVKRFYMPVSFFSSNCLKAILVFVPKEVVFLTDEADMDLERIRKVLLQRGLKIKVRSVKKEKFRPDTEIESAVVVLTDKDRGQEAYIEQHSKLNRLWRFRMDEGGDLYFKDGDHYTEFIFQKRRLSVQEQIFLAGLSDEQMRFSEEEEEMIFLRESGAELWNACSELEMSEILRMNKLLSELDERQNLRIVRNSAKEKRRCWESRKLPRRLLQDTGMETVLSALRSLAEIDIISSGPYAVIRGTNVSESMIGALNWMVECSMRDPYCHSFSVVQSEKDGCSIKDDTLVVNYEFCTEEYSAEDAAFLEKSFELLDAGTDGRQLIWSENGISQFILPVSNGNFRASFCYASEAVRKCLLDFRSLLRTVVYHQLIVETEPRISEIRSGRELGLNESAAEAIDFVCGCENGQILLVSCQIVQFSSEGKLQNCSELRDLIEKLDNYATKTGPETRVRIVYAGGGKVKVLDDYAAAMETITAEEELKREEFQAVLKSALDVLTEKERHLMIFKLGLEDGKKKTLDEVCVKFGVSQERVRLIERKTAREIFGHRGKARSRMLRDFLETCEEGRKQNDKEGQEEKSFCQSI